MFVVPRSNLDYLDKQKKPYTSRVTDCFLVIFRRAQSTIALISGARCKILTSTALLVLVDRYSSKMCFRK